MSDDRWKGNPIPSPRPWEPELKFGPVTADDFEAFTEWHARAFKCGKYRQKRATDPLPAEPRDRGDGQFGIGDVEPEPVETSE